MADTKLALAKAQFLFQIKSMDRPNFSLTFVNPLIESHRENISSPDDAFSRPFALHRHAQSIEAPTKTYSFPQLYLDSRFTWGATQESGGRAPNIEGIRAKLESLTRIDPKRQRKDRLLVRFGAQVFGKQGETYLYLSSVALEGNFYGQDGRLIGAMFSLEFNEYGEQ